MWNRAEGDRCPASRRSSCRASARCSRPCAARCSRRRAGTPLSAAAVRPRRRRAPPRAQIAATCPSPWVPGGDGRTELRGRALAAPPPIVRTLSRPVAPRLRRTALFHDASLIGTLARGATASRSAATRHAPPRAPPPPKNSNCILRCLTILFIQSAPPLPSPPFTAAVAAAVAVVFAVVVAVAVAVAVASGAIASDAAVASAVKTGAAREKARNDVTLVDVAAVLSVHKAICAIAGSASAAHDANRVGSKSSLIIGGSASAGGSLCRVGTRDVSGASGVRLCELPRARRLREAARAVGSGRGFGSPSCQAPAELCQSSDVWHRSAGNESAQRGVQARDLCGGIRAATRARGGTRARRTAARRAGDRGALHLVGGRKVGTRVVKWRLHHFGRRAHRLLDQGVYCEV